MIESLYYFLVIISGLFAAVGFDKKKGFLVAFGGLLLLLCGLLIMGSSPTSGIEKDYGTFVRYVGDNNYNIDVNVGYLNASNDYTLFILSNVFFYCGIALLISSFVVLVNSYRNKR